MNDDERIWYELGIIIGKKEYKDKIKAKIEELEKQQKEEPDAYLCIKVLRSLLENKEEKGIK